MAKEEKDNKVITAKSVNPKKESKVSYKTKNIKVPKPGDKYYEDKSFKVYNEDAVVEFIKDTKNHKAGDKSVMNHALADKLVKRGYIKFIDWHKDYESE